MMMMMMRNKSTRAFIRLLVLCLCVGGMIATDETRAPNGDAIHGIKSLPAGAAASSPITGHNWKYPRDQALNHHQQQQQQQQQRLHAMHAHVVVDNSVAESTFRRPFDSKYLNLKDEQDDEFEEEAPAFGSSNGATPGGYLQQGTNDLRNPVNVDNNNNNNVLVGDDDDDPELGQLNLHEAQLARLHGLGPAEIEALYNWQQRMRIPPMFNRNPAQHPHRSDAIKRSKVQQAGGGAAAAGQDVQLAGSPIGTASLIGGDPAASGNAEASNETSETPATWPKRSAPPEMKNKSPEKDGGKPARNGYNRKEKTDANGAGGGAGGKGGKGGGKSANRRPQQQSQESVPHFDNPANKGGAKDGASYEHVRGQGAPPDVSRINRNLATQFLLRSPRENRQYDVPIIECPPAEDGMERFACPTPDIVGRYRCIDDHVLCDGFIDCPGGEDEDGQACMFYKTMKAHLDLVADALLRWVRGR